MSAAQLGDGTCEAGACIVTGGLRHTSEDKNLRCLIDCCVTVSYRSLCWYINWAAPNI